MSKTNTRFYNWCFTSFGKNEPEFDPAKMIYLVYQQEMCPETKKLHWQGYVEFRAWVSLKKGQELLGCPNCHMEVRKGTQKQAIDYCKKPETRASVDAAPVEHGQPKRQGSRSDLDAMYDMAKQHCTVKEMLKVHQGNGMRHIHCYEKAALALLNKLETDDIIKQNRVNFVDSDPDEGEEIEPEQNVVPQGASALGVEPPPTAASGRARHAPEVPSRRSSGDGDDSQSESSSEEHEEYEEEDENCENVDFFGKKPKF